jgi:hypothetical protein
MNGDLRGESALFTPLAAFHVEIGRFPFTGGCESPLEIINWLRLLHPLSRYHPHLCLILYGGELSLKAGAGQPDAHSTHS